MANTQGNPAGVLIDALAEKKNCAQWSFFQAVRVLQAARGDLPPIGASLSPALDPIRFGQRPSLAFAPSTLDELVAGDPAKLYVNFFGLFGPNGPLPLHLTHQAIRRSLGNAIDPFDGMARAGEKSQAFARFADIFHHRLISLFFRAWAASQPLVDLDREGSSRFLFFLGAFFGESGPDSDAPPSQSTEKVSLRAKAFYAGWLSSGARNAEGLRAILSSYFGVPVRVLEFVGRWFPLQSIDFCRLGGAADSTRLGHSTILGARTWNSHLSFRIALGPLTLQQYEDFLPGEAGFQALQDWVHSYCGPELISDIQLILRRAEAPPICLGKFGKLGWTTWLGKSKPSADPDDLVINPTRQIWN